MTISQFPADRRLSEVKRCAEHLQDLHGEAANRFWRAEMTHFVGIMRNSGANDDEIRRQAALFLSAVQAELELSFGRGQSIHH